MSKWAGFIAMNAVSMSNQSSEPVSYSTCAESRSASCKRIPRFSVHFLKDETSDHRNHALDCSVFLLI